MNARSSHAVCSSVMPGPDRGDHHLAVAGGGQAAPADGHLVVAQQGQRGAVVVAQRELAPVAGQRGDRPQRGPAAQRPEQVGELLGQVGMTHQLDPVLGQQRLPVGRGQVPLAAAVQHPVGQQHPGADQPVVGGVQQSDVDRVRGVVAGAGHQVVQPEVGVDQPRRRGAVGQVVEPLARRPGPEDAAGRAAGRAATLPLVAAVRRRRERAWPPLPLSRLPLAMSESSHLTAHRRTRLDADVDTGCGHLDTRCIT